APAFASTAEYIPYGLGRRERQARHAMGRAAGIGIAEASVHIACSPWRVALVIPCAGSNLRWGIGTLPRQTGVYVPRRLSHVSGPVTCASSRRACDAMTLPLFAWLVSCRP